MKNVLDFLLDLGMAFAISVFFGMGFWTGAILVSMITGGY